MNNDVNATSDYPRKYIMFPIFLVEGMFSNKESTIDKMLKYGIYRMAKTTAYDLQNVARQIIYKMYRGNLNPDIKRGLSQYQFDFIGEDEGANSFTGETFNPELEIEELLTVLESNKQLMDLCIIDYCINQSLTVLELKGNSQAILKCGLEVEGMIKSTQVMVMIGKHTLFDFRDNDKTEKEIAQLLAYIAVRSIIGEKAYTKTNKELIVCRMFGYASTKEIKGHELSELHKKYLLRYHIDKVLKALEMDWNVCIYSNRTRGIYVSINKKFSLQKLVEVAEKKKQAKRESEFEKLKQSIIQAAKNTASNTTN
jgi:hypothetical protein